MFPHFGYMCVEGRCLPSDWVTLTLARTGEQTIFLLRSKHAFSIMLLLLSTERLKSSQTEPFSHLPLRSFFTLGQLQSFGSQRRFRWNDVLSCDRPAWRSLTDHSWNARCTLYPAVQQLTISKDEAGLVFRRLSTKERKSSPATRSALGHTLRLPSPGRNIGYIVDAAKSASIV